MIENKEAQPFEITLPEGKTYNDLNEAHQADSEDEGNREESLYPTKQAQLDNSESYRSEMTLADTRELINKLKSRLQTLKGNDGEETEASEFDVRTGNDEGTKQSLERRIDKKEEGFNKQDEMAKRHVERMSTLKTKNDVDMWAGFAKSDMTRGEITDLQFQEIKEAADTRISELGTAQTKDYVERMSTVKTKNDVDMWAGFAKSDMTRGEITDLQLQEVQEAADARMVELSTAKTKDYVERISALKDKGNVDMWAGFAKGDMTRGEITDSQLQEIMNVTANKTAEINEGVGEI